MKSGENGPAVSVVIPAYNVEKYLGSCLDSVLQQRVYNIEIICVEDGSSDATLDIIREYCKRDNRVKMINYAGNKGTAYARNRGLEAAVGKYVYFLDADDLVKPEIFSALIEYADRNETDCIYFDSELQDEEHIGNLRLRFDLPDIAGKVLSGTELFCVLMKNNAYTGSVWRQFWRREFLTDSNIKYPEGLLGEDAEFSIRAMLSAPKCMCIDEVYHIYRRHGGTMSTDVSSQKTISIFKIYCHLLEVWGQNKFSEEVNNRFDEYMCMRFKQARRLYMRNKNLISEKDFEHGIERHLYHKLLVKADSNEFLKLNPDDLLKLRSANEIIVYGAGNYAVDVIAYLDEIDISVNAIAVTQKHSNTTSINDLPIYEIEELEAEHKQAFIVLGVKSIKSRMDIVKELQKRKVLNIIDSVSEV